MLHNTWTNVAQYSLYDVGTGGDAEDEARRTLVTCTYCSMIHDQVNNKHGICPFNVAMRIQIAKSCITIPPKLCFAVKPSLYRSTIQSQLVQPSASSPNNNSGGDIGVGLFALYDIPAKANLLYFVGVLKQLPQSNNGRNNSTKSQKKATTPHTSDENRITFINGLQDLHPGYTIKIGKDLYLDCYDAYVQGSCIASCANTAVGLVPILDSRGSSQPSNNANLVVSASTRKAHLVSTKPIKAHEEILFAYQSGFFKPTTKSQT